MKSLNLQNVYNWTDEQKVRYNNMQLETAKYLDGLDKGFTFIKIVCMDLTHRGYGFGEQTAKSLIHDGPERVICTRCHNRKWS